MQVTLNKSYLYARSTYIETKIHILLEQLWWIFKHLIMKCQDLVESLSDFSVCLIRALHLSLNIPCICHCFVLRVHICCLSCNILQNLLYKKSMFLIWLKWKENGCRKVGDNTKNFQDWMIFSIVVYHYTYEVYVLYLDINFDHFKKAYLLLNII